eukprot:3105572-Prymnesium_polylepis.1
MHQAGAGTARGFVMQGGFIGTGDVGVVSVSKMNLPGPVSHPFASFRYQSAGSGELLARSSKV